MEEPQDVTNTLFVVPPVLRHLHPFHVLGLPHMRLKGSLVDKHRIQADYLGI
jgi:hypothetical protein